MKDFETVDTPESTPKKPLNLEMIIKSTCQVVIAASLLTIAVLLIGIKSNMENGNKIADFQARLLFETGNVVFSANELLRDMVYPNYISVYDTIPGFVIPRTKDTTISKEALSALKLK